MKTFFTRKLWILSLLCVLSVVLTFGSMVTASYADSLTSARTQLNQVKLKQSQERQKVAYLSSKEQAIETQLSSITRAIQTDSSHIAILKDRLRISQQHLLQTAQQAASARRKMLAVNGVLKERLRVMYESGSVSYLEVLFSATSFSDFLNRMSALTLIAKQDQQLLIQVKAQRAHYNAMYKLLWQQRASEETMFGNLSYEQRQQTQKLAQRRVVLADVQQQKAAAIADIQSELQAEQNLANTIVSLLRVNPSIANTAHLHLGTGAWIWPVPHYYDITSGYGWRNIFGGNEFHNGIDIGAPDGTPIEAVADGVVLYAGTAYGFGHWIVLKHANGLLTIYGHMYASGLLVKPGDVVKQGQVIAYVGADGQATGPHLHFTVATGFNASGFPVSLNPLNYVHD